MKLTHTIRKAFVDSVMNDTPYIDYNAQIRDALMAAAVRALPSTVRTVWEDSSTRSYIETLHDYAYGVSILAPTLQYSGVKELLTEDERRHLRELELLGDEQTKTRDDLHAQLTAVANSVTTRKALAEALPEFAKYLPAEDGKNAYPVAVANVVTAFMKAGWPKGKAEATAAA